MTQSAPIRFSTTDDREELYRAEVYGLLAQLFFAPPSDDLYEQLRLAPTEAPAAGAFLERAWEQVVAAARRVEIAAARSEFDALFQGVGKPEIFLYASYYLAGSVNERPLVQLRDDLRSLGLARADGVEETEDHLACLCEVMRYLIAGDAAGEPGGDTLATQRAFHAAYLRPWVDALFSDIAGHPHADFYAALAGFARDFFSVEQQAFDLVDA
jgi:TorA maturation chaperone TorD